MILKYRGAEISDGTWRKRDQRFHPVLNRVLGNQMLTLFVDIFWVAFDNAIEPAVNVAPDPHLTLDEYRRVLEAVEPGDERLSRGGVL